MIALGLGGFFHDFNAAAVDTKTGHVALAEEERFSRRKHHPLHKKDVTSTFCVEYVLSELGVSADDVELVVFSDAKPGKATPYLKGLFAQARHVHVEHHLCHAAAAYYSSGKDQAAILSMDGFGDDASGLLALGSKGKITPLRYISIPNSIGMEFLRVTYQIGLGSHGSEGKTQGLAAYAEPRFLQDYLDNTTLLDNGTFKFSGYVRGLQEWIQGGHYMDTKHLFNDFILDRITRRIPPEELEEQHMALACSVQELLNIVSVHAARCLRKETGAPTLVTTGGVALNSTMNGYLLANSGFENIYAHPSSSDRGNALGAVLYHLANELGIDVDFKMDDVYFGQQFGQGEIKAALESNNLRYDTVGDPQTIAAQMAADGKIVGWFQGRSEIGARALGNRSIIADPRRAENKDIVNAKVKHREWFRPFAPSVMEQHAAEYFDCDRGLPFMTFTVDVAQDKRDIIPAITHVDGTARIQTVSARTNPLYHSLIDEFRKITGVPVVMNTSFNDNGEPIVETPEDAVHTLLNTGLDALIIGDCVVDKAEQAKQTITEAA